MHENGAGRKSRAVARGEIAEHNHRVAHPAFPHWALAQLPFDEMGRTGLRLRAALACLARRWPAPLAHDPVRDRPAKAGIARALTSQGRGP